MSSNTMRSNILITIASFIWGTTFVAQSIGANYVGAFTFNSLRNFIAIIILLPYIYFSERTPKNIPKKTFADHGGKSLVIGGITCGLCLTFASALQQHGMAYTTVSKAGFITAMYIVLVPLIRFFTGKKVRLIAWFSTVLAVFGLYLLCINETLSLSKGDLLVLGSAFCFAFQILSVDHFSSKVSCVRLAWIEFFTCGVLSAIPALLFETINLQNIFAAWLPILYAGALSSGVAYTLQIIAQKNTDPVTAGLLMSLESVFSLLAGWLILNQYLTIKELIGCVIIFVAIILTQLPEKPAHSKGSI